MSISDLDVATLRIDRRGLVLEVTIDNPKGDLNAVDGMLHEELAALFRELRSENDARAVLLTGSKRACCAGDDFAWFPELQGLEKLDTVRRDGKQILWDLLNVEAPIVAALNGPAVGLGASIALLCDVIFMAPRSGRWCSAPLALRYTKLAVNPWIKSVANVAFEGR